MPVGEDEMSLDGKKRFEIRRVKPDPLISDYQLVKNSLWDWWLTEKASHFIYSSSRMGTSVDQIVKTALSFLDQRVATCHTDVDQEMQIGIHSQSPDGKIIISGNDFSQVSTVANNCVSKNLQSETAGPLRKLITDEATKILNSAKAHPDPDFDQNVIKTAVSLSDRIHNVYLQQSSVVVRNAFQLNVKDVQGNIKIVDSKFQQIAVALHQAVLDDSQVQNLSKELQSLLGDISDPTNPVDPGEIEVNVDALKYRLLSLWVSWLIIWMWFGGKPFHLFLGTLGLLSYQIWGYASEWYPYLQSGISVQARNANGSVYWASQRLWWLVVIMGLSVWGIRRLRRK